MSTWTGCAHREAAAALSNRLLPACGRRELPTWTAPDLGWGTLPGELKNIVDSKYERALPQVLAGGINLIDTSPAYRCRRSQAAVGRALDQVLTRGEARREELLLTTHVGWLAFDRQEEEPMALLEREVLPATGLGPSDFVGRVWSLHPAWIRNQLDLACRLMRVEHFDFLILDAPETGLRVWPRTTWRSRMMDAFTACEELRAEGRITGYGIASLEGFRAKTTATEAEGKSILDLDELLDFAASAGGSPGGFQVLQLPYSLAALDVLNLRCSTGKPLLEQAAAKGLWIQFLLGLGQGQLAQGLPGYFNEIMPGLSSAQQALQVLRSTPGAHTTLVGMKTREHIEENLALLQMPRLGEDSWRALFAGGA